MFKILLPLLLLFLTIIQCSNTTEIKTPLKIGAKNRTKIITGKEAANLIDKLHNLKVSPQNNLVAEYGSQDPDILYISEFTENREAREAFDTMLEKMKQNKRSPFSHVMTLSKYDHKVFMALGLDAIHYIYFSGPFTLWITTYQKFGMDIPLDIVELYPI